MNWQPIPVAAGTRYLRTSLFDEATDDEDDIDLYGVDEIGETLVSITG